MSLALLLLLGSVFFILWYRGAFLPRWIEWDSISPEAAAMLPDGARAQKELRCDLDGDGNDEILVLCWKHGRYLGARPFWESRDTIRFIQHIYIYQNDGTPRWMSSGVPEPVADWAFEDHLLILISPAGNESRWVWDGFGLTLVN